MLYYLLHCLSYLPHQPITYKLLNLINLAADWLVGQGMFTRLLDNPVIAYGAKSLSDCAVYTDCLRL